MRSKIVMFTLLVLFIDVPWIVAFYFLWNR